MNTIKNRRFPHFLSKKWDHERADHTIKDQPHPSDNRDAYDEEEPNFTLCFITKKLLSEPMIINNNRIVVVGASDAGIGFIETLLSIRHVK
jgi:hypothetical protein